LSAITELTYCTIRLSSTPTALSAGMDTALYCRELYVFQNRYSLKKLHLCDCCACSDQHVELLLLFNTAPNIYRFLVTKIHEHCLHSDRCLLGYFNYLSAVTVLCCVALQ